MKKSTIIIGGLIGLVASVGTFFSENKILFFYMGVCFLFFCITSKSITYFSKRKNEGFGISA